MGTDFGGDARCSLQRTILVRHHDIGSGHQPMTSDRASTQGQELVELTAKIVAAFVSNNSINSGDLPQLINETHAALARATGQAPEVEREEQRPKVAIKKSVMPDYIICLEDGKKFKSLKRHLRTHYNMTPEEYREKWSLPHDYPMVAPNYARQRSDLAKKMGLGTRRD
jgi:predicted transcriptional regulator